MSTQASPEVPVRPTRGDGGLPHLYLSPVLAAVSVVAAAWTLFVPDLLTGPAAMKGSARGTALVVLVVAVPVLVWGISRARAGSVRGLVLAAGATAYLLYNAVLLLFGTPLNHAFLVYVAMLGLALWTLIGLCLRLWSVVDRLDSYPPRWVATYLWVIVGLNALAWLVRIVPALVDRVPTTALEGTGLTTNPVWVQDLAFWLPAIAWLGLGVWRAVPQRVALAAAAGLFWVIEGVSVAADQWVGHLADPSSDVVSMAVVPAFALLAAIGVWPVVTLLRTLPVERS